MFNLVTPTEINEFILFFCNTISNDKPFFVDVIPETFASVNECFPNVEKKISLDGGEVIYGWQIWIDPKVFIEAEFHGIWKSNIGSIIDITPKMKPIKKILFLPDRFKKYEGFQVQNIRLKIINNGVIDDLFACHETLFIINNHGKRKFEKEITYKGNEIEVIRFLMNTIAQLENYISNKNNRNSPCFCGSGNRYKRCCGEIIRHHIDQIREYYVCN